MHEGVNAYMISWWDAMRFWARPRSTHVVVHPHVLKILLSNHVSLDPQNTQKKNNGNQTCLTRWSLVSHSIISLQNHTTITHIVVLGGTWFSLLLIFSIEYLEWNIFSNSWAKLSYANSTIPLFWTKERQISKHLTTL